MMDLYATRLFPITALESLLNPGGSYNTALPKFLFLTLCGIDLLLASVWRFDSSLQSHRNSETRNFLAILYARSSSVNITTFHLLGWAHKNNYDSIWFYFWGMLQHVSVFLKRSKHVLVSLKYSILIKCLLFQLLLTHMYSWFYNRYNIEQSVAFKGFFVVPTERQWCFLILQSVSQHGGIRPVVHRTTRRCVFSSQKENLEVL